MKLLGLVVVGWSLMMRIFANKWDSSASGWWRMGPPSTNSQSGICQDLRAWSSEFVGSGRSGGEPQEAELLGLDHRSASTADLPAGRRGGPEDARRASHDLSEFGDHAAEEARETAAKSIHQMMLMLEVDRPVVQFVLLRTPADERIYSRAATRSSSTEPVCHWFAINHRLLGHCCRCAAAFAALRSL